MLDELTNREIDVLTECVVKELPKSPGIEGKARQILNNHRQRPDELVIYGVVYHIKKEEEGKH